MSCPPPTVYAFVYPALLSSIVEISLLMFDVAFQTSLGGQYVTHSSGFLLEGTHQPYIASSINCRPLSTLHSSVFSALPSGTVALSSLISGIVFQTCSGRGQATYHSESLLVGLWRQYLHCYRPLCEELSTPDHNTRIHSAPIPSTVVRMDGTATTVSDNLYTFSVETGLLLDTNCSISFTVQFEPKTADSIT